MGITMKKYIKMICVSLVSTGAILFMGSAYSSGLVGQPQFDAPATTGSVATAENASVNSAAVAANEPAGPSAQLSAGQSGAVKQAPAPANGQQVEFFQNVEAVR